MSDRHASLIAALSREGMATVWDHEGRYLGCIGIETWLDLVAKEKARLGSGETGAHPPAGGTFDEADTRRLSPSADSPQCAPDGSTHFHDGGDRCVCGQQPSVWGTE